MFLVDCARANGLRASSYLKVATDNLASVAFLESDGFLEVWKSTVCGVRNLNVLVNCDHPFLVPTNGPSEWAQMTFQVPPMVHSAPFELIKENEGKIDDFNWHFYRHVNDQCLACPSLLATAN
jgi:hypothetical protein